MVEKITIPNKFVKGKGANATKVNENFDALANTVNESIDETNTKANVSLDNLNATGQGKLDAKADWTKQPQNTDFNTLTADGFYKIYVTAGKNVNQPPEGPTYNMTWLIMTINQTSNYLAQYAFNMADSSIYARRYSNGWLAWEKIAGSLVIRSATITSTTCTIKLSNGITIQCGSFTPSSASGTFTYPTPFVFASFAFLQPTNQNVDRNFTLTDTLTGFTYANCQASAKNFWLAIGY